MGNKRLEVFIKVLIHRIITPMIYYQKILSSGFPDTLMAQGESSECFQKLFF